MNIEKLGRKAIETLRQRWGLPESGFVCGGSISNIIWELVSGKEAVINDIDIFYFDGEMTNTVVESKKSLFKYKEIEKLYFEDYKGMCFNTVSKNFYTIVDSEREGIFNNVKYKSNKANLQIILKSFDINCTKVGYSIDEDKLYWTTEFVDFLKSGELKVCNLMTPSHTAIRITKKKHELGCKLDEFEYKLLQHAFDYTFNDVIKLRFKERYLEMFNKYYEDLTKYFDIKRDVDLEEFVMLNYQKEVELHRLFSKNNHRLTEIEKQEVSDKTLEEVYERRGVFSDKNIQRIKNSLTFLFYMRNIYGHKHLEDVWFKLDYFYNDIDYIDTEVSKEDIELLERFSKNAPRSIEKLKGLKISHQLNLIKKLLEKYKEDPIIAISILEKYKFSDDFELDDYTSLLLELSVRKEILNDTRSKVKSILGAADIDEPIETDDYYSLNF